MDRRVKLLLASLFTFLAITSITVAIICLNLRKNFSFVFLSLFSAGFFILISILIVTKESKPSSELRIEMQVPTKAHVSIITKKTNTKVSTTERINYG